MLKESKIVYDMLISQFKQTASCHVSIEVPFELRNKRKVISNDLVTEGLISNVSIYGQQSFSCTLVDDQLCTLNIEY